MSGQVIPSDTFNKNQVEVTLPEFRGLPAVSFQLTALKEAERRLIEAKTVNPSTYNELEYVMNESYRELKRNLSSIGYQVLKTEAELDKSRAAAILDKYPEFLVGKPAKFDNASVREAFISRDEDVRQAQERLDSLKALQMFLEGKVRVMENVCQYMRNSIKLVMRSTVNSNLY